MIQLASDPAASRLNWRTSEAAKAPALPAGGGRRAHAWPFISRHAEKPAPASAAKKAGESGS